MDEALFEHFAACLLNRVDETEALLRLWKGARREDPEGVIVGALCFAERLAPGFLDQQADFLKRAEVIAGLVIRSVKVGIGDPEFPMRLKSQQRRPVVEATYELARPLVLSDPAAGLNVARLLREMCERTRCHLASVVCLEADAYRLLGRAGEAEATLNRAASWLSEDQAEGDTAAYLRSVGLLRIDQRRLVEGCALLEESRRHFRSLGDEHEASAWQALAAMVRYEKEGSSAQLTALLGALRGLREDRCPGLVHRTVLTAAHLLANLGAGPSARSLLGERWRGGEGEERVWSLWLEGRVFALLGEVEEGSVRISEAQNIFEQSNYLYEFALSAWDLACVYGRLRDRTGVERLADGVMKKARSLPVLSSIVGLFSELLGPQDETSYRESRKFLKLSLDAAGLAPSPVRFA